MICSYSASCKSQHLFYTSSFHIEKIFNSWKKKKSVDKSHLNSTNDYLMEQHKLEVNTIYRLFYNSILLRNNLHIVKPQILKLYSLRNADKCMQVYNIIQIKTQNISTQKIPSCPFSRSFESLALIQNSCGPDSG